MKVLLVNGSPHKEGCTYTALKEVEKELNAEGVETEIYWLGVKPISGCLGCAQCIKRGPNGEKPSLRCFMDDCVNEFLDKADGGDYISALSAKICLQQESAYYTSPAFNGSSVARDQVGALLKKCVVDAADAIQKNKSDAEVMAIIEAAFDEAVAKCKYEVGN